MKARKIVIIKEIWTDWRIKELKEFEKGVDGTVDGIFETKQIQVNVIKEGGKK